MRLEMYPLAALSATGFNKICFPDGRTGSFFPDDVYGFSFIALCRLQLSA